MPNTPARTSKRGDRDGQDHRALAVDDLADLERHACSLEQLTTQAIERGDAVEQKGVHDRVAAFEASIAKLARNRRLTNRVAACRVRLERAIGQQLRDDLGRGRPRKDDTARTFLADLAIGNRESSDWQHLAEISGHEFEAEIQRMLDGGERLGTAPLVRFATRARDKKVPTAPQSRVSDRKPPRHYGTTEILVRVNVYVGTDDEAALQACADEVAQWVSDMVLDAVHEAPEWNASVLNVELLGKPVSDSDWDLGMLEATIPLDEDDEQ
jgi:hypothetical protein